MNREEAGHLYIIHSGNAILVMYERLFGMSRLIYQTTAFSVFVCQLQSWVLFKENDILKKNKRNKKKHIYAAFPNENVSLQAKALLNIK